MESGSSMGARSIALSELFDYSLVFPAGDPPLLARSAPGLHRAAAAVARRITAERQPMLDSGIAPDQSLACRAALRLCLRLEIISDPRCPRRGGGKECAPFR